MFKKVLYIMGFILIPLIFVIGCSSGPDARIKAGLGQEFNLPVGQTALINGENLLIKFDAVTADSRCPKGVQCIWAGEARCQTHFSFSNNDMAPAQLELVDSGGRVDGYSQATWISNTGTYTINFRLDPYPEAGKLIAKTDYTLIMMITR
jgi:hypothetical protein